MTWFQSRDMSDFECEKPPERSYKAVGRGFSMPKFTEINFPKQYYDYHVSLSFLLNLFNCFCSWFTTHSFSFIFKLLLEKYAFGRRV